MTRSVRALACALPVPIALWALAAVPAQARDEKIEVVAGKPGPLPKDVSPGISACATCHSGADQRGVNLFVTLHKSHEFIKFDESTNWRTNDVHSVAHLALASQLGKQMGTELGYDVTKAPQCLTCHAVDLTPAAPFAEKQFFATQGVNCAGCHGTKETWQVRHYKEAADGSGIVWRGLAPAEKAEAGLADLRNPVVRAKLCVSCHVGAPGVGKVVTHDMYAAGHPPLPPFELASFQEGEPRHWGRPTELPYFKSVPAEKTWALYRFHPTERENYDARQMAAGAVAALRAEGLKLLAAAEEAQRPDSDGMDYAAFDCYSCHHELRSKSDRQTRAARDGRGGRPTVRKAAGLLTAVVVESAAQGPKELSAKVAGFEERWAALRGATVSKGVGRAKRVATAAADLVTWCDGVLRVLEEYPQPIYTKGHVERLDAALSAATQKVTADPDGALTLSWAYLALRGRDATGTSAFAKVVPVSVRVAPFGTEARGSFAPVPPRSDARMDWVAEFETNRFRAGFKSALGAK